MSLLHDHGCSACGRPRCGRRSSVPIERAREAILKVPADQASLRIVIRAEADTVAEAMRSAGTRINKITDFLDSLDIEPGKERRTGGYSLEPIWSQRPRNPAEDWKPTVLGHRLEHRILIETTRLELVGELLAKSAQAWGGRSELGWLWSFQSRSHGPA